MQINQYLSLYARSGVLPSKLLQGKAMEVCTAIELHVFILSNNIFLVLELIQLLPIFL